MSDEINSGDAEITTSFNATDVTPGGFWPMMPGDRVLCIVPHEAPVDGASEVSQAVVSGTVQRIMIPGPMSPHKTVEVLLDEDMPIKIPGVRAGWFDPETLERV